MISLRPGEIIKLSSPWAL